mmetsp:Transcript_5182/g.6818  ORF Transcript_5182/g.6818 Transcript_5182/m.6818 type:complete len:132 (-) Transcript_5182:31-426(-)
MLGKGRILEGLKEGMAGSPVPEPPEEGGGGTPADTGGGMPLPPIMGLGNPPGAPLGMDPLRVGEGPRLGGGGDGPRALPLRVGGGVGPVPMDKGEMAAFSGGRGILVEADGEELGRVGMLFIRLGLSCFLL